MGLKIKVILLEFVFGMALKIKNVGKRYRLPTFDGMLFLNFDLVFAERKGDFLFAVFEDTGNTLGECDGDGCLFVGGDPDLYFLAVFGSYKSACILYHADCEGIDNNVFVSG